MSRCFPYPPPGYTLSGIRKEALIESIKLHKQKVKAEEQRKREKRDKKREKKEKRKEKKEKKNLNLDGSKAVRGHIHEKIWTGSIVELSRKESKTESELLERSSLTEEHEKPVCLRAPSSSFDSTENSNKRKRQSSPTPDISRGHGNIIRIRLASKKQKQSDASANEHEPCSTSGRTHFPSQTKDDTTLRLRTEGCTSQLASNNDIGQHLVLRTDRGQLCSTTKQIEKTTISPTTDAVMTLMKKEELLYKSLIENWVPPQLQDVTSSDAEEQDWLFPSKNEKKGTCKEDRIYSYCSTSSLQPHAAYLPEVDVYALPFTIPF